MEEPPKQGQGDTPTDTPPQLHHHESRRDAGMSNPEDAIVDRIDQLSRSISMSCGRCGMDDSHEECLTELLDDIEDGWP